MSTQIENVLSHMEGMTPEESHDCALYVMAYADALNYIKSNMAKNDKEVSG